MSNGTEATITPVIPPMTKMTMKPMTNRNGVLKIGRPAHIVASQQKICSPAGTAIAMLEAVKEALAKARKACNEHVVDPKPKGQDPRRDQRHDHAEVAKNRPTREGRDDGRYHADCRQEDDVDLRMAEEPEQVLPQQHIAAFGRVEEVRADKAVEDKAVLAIMIAGMARMIRNDVTSIDQTKETESGRATCPARAA